MQLRECQKYAEDNALTVVDIFQDKMFDIFQHGEVVTELDRRESFKYLLCRLNEIDAILVSDISRLWGVESVSYVLINRMLRQNNKDVIVISEPDFSIYKQGINDSMFSEYFRLLDQYDNLRKYIAEK